MANYILKGSDFQNKYGQQEAQVRGDIINNKYGQQVGRVSGDIINNRYGQRVASINDVKKAIQGATGKMTDVALWWFFVR